MAQRVYVGGLPPEINERELEDEVRCGAAMQVGLPSCGLEGMRRRRPRRLCMRQAGRAWDQVACASFPPLRPQFGRFGRLRNVWVARKPPGFGECMLWCWLG